MSQPPWETPSKSRAGLVIGIVVGMLTVIAAVVLAVVLVAGSDSSSDNDSAGADETTAQPSETETPVPPEGEVLKGDGYSYVLPENWKDLTQDVVARTGLDTIDTASAPGASLESTFANLIVEAGPANGETDLDAARDQVSSNLGAAVGAVPVETDGINIDGVATVGLQVTSTNESGVDVLQDASVTILHDTYYVIGFSRQSGNSDYDADFESILASWTWE